MPVKEGITKRQSNKRGIPEPAREAFWAGEDMPRKLLTEGTGTFCDPLTLLLIFL